MSDIDEILLFLYSQTLRRVTLHTSQGWNSTIPHKNYETAHMKERLCLPSPLQSNVDCDKVQILLNSWSFNFQHCLQGGRGATI